MQSCKTWSVVTCAEHNVCKFHPVLASLRTLLLNNILCIWCYILLFHQLLNFWVVATLWLFWICCYEHLCYKLLCIHMCSLLFAVSLREELLGHMFNFLRICPSDFWTNCLPFNIPPSETCFLHILTSTWQCLSFGL